MNPCDNPYCTVEYDPEKKICKDCKHNPLCQSNDKPYYGLKDKDIKDFMNILFGGKK